MSMSPMEQSARDKAAYRMRKADEAEKARNDKRKTKGKIALWVAVLVGGWLLIDHIDDKQAAAYDAQVQAKYAKWVAFREANCKVSEKVYGLSMTSGKFSSNDNAVVYECKDGIKYMMSQKVEEAIKAGHGNVSFIPEVK